MLKKKSNKKGFTIMEMLIVVAIIAVLAAIAIPTMSSALTKAKEATDVANLRAAYAEAQVKILTEEATPATAYTEPKLNYTTGKYTAPVEGNTYTITYKTDKLDGGKTYTWTLGGGAEVKSNTTTPPAGSGE